MKLEMIKSFILTFLVGISLLLTFGLWSYEPNNEPNTGQKLQNVVDIGGQGDLEKQDLIRPSSIIFHANNEHYGFADPGDMLSLYEDIQFWTLYDFQLTQEKEQSLHTEQVEIDFPTAIPMEALRSLLTISNVDSITLPTWSFDQIIITFNQRREILEVHFISENNRQQATALVNNPDKYNKLWAYITEKKGLSELIAFDTGEKSIYIPLNDVTLDRRQYTVDYIDPTKLVSALFPETTLVSESGNYYNDGTRELRVLNNFLSMRFINSALQESEYTRIPVLDLLNFSIRNINDHKGWTGDYKLIKIDPQSNMVRYQMYYEGYPTFSNANLSIIEQYWRGKDGDLYQYNRPLISLKGVLPEAEEVTLKSGLELISYLERNYSAGQGLARIQDIKIGYQYTYNSDLSSAILNPAWFMKIGNEWELINFEPIKGGEVDAMEPN
ncbi:YycH family regulatory protein [Virgibacillus necropolis]|uniref:Regulatory protein YycH domain-containing protein n=1 Tax=Virgibacillus necropolis TaxID=163877 RepID=A0A221M858_9BACI|nr:two-component system activity regulator YycH [Virgibacillus necropolis]ASN03824.1 hypothetical protein CFK40_01805 [Virgibacillus necropolis]